MFLGFLLFSFRSLWNCLLILLDGRQKKLIPLPQIQCLSVGTRLTIIDDVVQSEEKLKMIMFQVGKIFLISMANWTIVLVISLSSLTRLPGASESRT